MSNICPLCGNNKDSSDLFCESCKKKIENEYEVDINNKHSIQQKVNIEPIKQKIEEEPKPIATLAQPKRRTKVPQIAMWIAIITVGAITSFFVFKNTVIQGNREKSKWNEAIKENTISSYLDYMISFPKGKNYQLAEDAIMNLKRGESDRWMELQYSDNSAALKDFIANNPQTAYKPLVRKRLDSLSWCASLKDNTKESYQRYLTQSWDGEFEGFYMNEAKERLYLLSQRQSIVATELDSIKQTIDGFFVALSAINADNLERYLAPRVFQFYNIGGGYKEKIVGDLLISGSKKQSPTINFVPDISSITYEKTTIEHYKVNVPLHKVVTNQDGSLENKYGYIEKIELDTNFQIVTISELRPNK